MKPTNVELVASLRSIVRWATGLDRSGNPYCHAEVKAALKALARYDGISEKNYLDVNLEREEVR